MYLKLLHSNFHKLANPLFSLLQAASKHKLNYVPTPDFDLIVTSEGAKDPSELLERITDVCKRQLNLKEMQTGSSQGAVFVLDQRQVGYRDTATLVAFEPNFLGKAVELKARIAVEVEDVKIDPRDIGISQAGRVSVEEEDRLRLEEAEKFKLRIYQGVLTKLLPGVAQGLEARKATFQKV